MTTCTDIAERREKCLAYAVKNYKQWPAETTLSPGAASHYGYSWRKLQPNWPWILENGVGDIIDEAAYTKHYEDNVMMSDHFDTECYAHLVPHNTGVITIKFSEEQFRAMAVAIRRYDGMKATIRAARIITERLTQELGE